MRQSDKPLTDKADMMWANIEERVKQSLDEMEAERRKTLRLFIKHGSVAGFAMAAITYIITLLVEYFNSYHFGSAIYLALLVFVASFVAYYYHDISHLKGLYHTKIMRHFLDVISKDNGKEGRKQTSNTSITSAPFHHAGNSVIFNANRNQVATHLDDSITGKVDDNRFFFGEVKYTNKFSNSWFSRWFKDNLLFQGLIFFAHFNKEFSGRVLVCTKRRWRTLAQDKRFRTVVMEDITFNKTFNVKTFNEQEAFYVLSTSLIERITTLQRHIKQNMHEKHLILLFEGKRVYILVPSLRDRFEPRMFSRLSLNSVKNDFHTLQIMLSIVDELNLNTRIWTKE